MDIPQLRAEDLISPSVGAGAHIEYSIATTSPLHCHDFYEIFFITAGRCRHWVNHQESILATGQMVLIRPDDAHCYYFLPQRPGPIDSSFYNVNFTSSLLRQTIAYLACGSLWEELIKAPFPACVTVTGPQLDFLSGQADCLRRCRDTDPGRAKLAAKTFLACALSLFFSQQPPSAAQSAPLWFDSLLIQMQQPENFCAGIERMQRLAGVSRGHLNRIFRSRLQVSPLQYLNRLRLGYAHELLLCTDLPILEISMAAGYENLSHFYHQFSKNYSLSPGALRKAYRANAAQQGGQRYEKTDVE